MTNWSKVEKDIESGPLGLVKWIFIFVIFLGIIFGGMSFFSTNAERFIVENSFQYKEGMKAQVAIYESTLEELEIRIKSDPTNQELLNQRSFVKAKLKSLEK